MKQIDLDQLLQIHVIVISSTGGGAGIRDLGRLEAAIATQRQEIFGQELYKTIYDKAAAMIRGIISDHPFIDGNKRTALLAGLTFLEINGVKFAAEQGELEDFAVQVATEPLDIPTISRWLSTRTS